MKRAIAKVEKNVALGPGVHEITLHAPGWAGDAAPGQFAMIRCPGPEPLLARPLAFLSADAERVRFGLKVYGRGSAILAAAPVGTELVVWGPLGRGFGVYAGKRHVLVGGGIGVPPLVMQAAKLKASGARIAAVIVGARTKAELFGRDELTRLGLPVSVCTDDGSEGTKGFVTAVLEKERLDGEAVVQSCGPTPMMTAVAKIAAGAGAACELSLEARMGCGVGACRGCMVPVAAAAKAPEGRYPGREYLCLCLDGPAVDARDIDLVKLREIH